jgi:hypothetical protein
VLVVWSGAFAAETFQLAHGSGRNHLEHAAPGHRHRIGECGDLFRRREGSRYW